MKIFPGQRSNSFWASTLAALFVPCLATFLCTAQTTPSGPAAVQQDQQPRRQVLFSRSTDENGQTATKSALPGAQPAAGEPTPALEAERKAVTFTGYDLDVRLRPEAQQIAVRAKLTLRNDGKAPLERIPLQISSTLNWERVRIDSPDGRSQEATFQVATLNSDADHTGQLHEAVVALQQRLAPGATLQLDATYSGTIAASARRLLAIGAPDEAALHADWDQISLPFTGLRGFGNVVWYPTASVPVLLGEGARLFDEMGEHKLRLSGARFRLRLTVEFPHGQAPTVALINGRTVPLAITESGASLDQSQEVASVATADSGSTTLGFEAPSLFVAIRTARTGTNLTAWTVPENDAQAWFAAATKVTPLLEGWLGKQPRSPLALLDLPDPEDAPFESGALLVAPLSETSAKANSDALNGVLVHALSHAWISPPNSPPPPAWLNEGLAAFMGTLWVERQQGRDAALRTLEADRAALALAEPESPGQSAGQPLATAISPVYYRTKAAYVLWMLRDLVGDATLSSALRAYYAAGSDAATEANKAAVGRNFEKLLEAAGSHRDLGWFFADWIDADKGLPDLSIDGVFPESASAGNWLVAVNVANAGYAAAELPVTVRSGDGSDAREATQRVLVPARGKITVRILIQGKPTEAQANDGTVPETQASVHVTRLE